MFGAFSYTVLLIPSLIIPSALILAKHWKSVLKYRNVLLILFLTWFITSMIIDRYTRLDGFWINPDDTNSGIYIFAIPLEDVIASALVGVWLPIFTLVVSLKEEKGELKFKRL